MAKQFPDSFSSYDEYEGYAVCCGKAMPGDQAVVYVVERPKGLIGPSRINTNRTAAVTIIGRRADMGLDAERYEPGTSKFRTTLLLGTDESIGFWRIHSSYHLNSLENLPMTDTLKTKFQYGYWAFIKDIKIKRIIKT